MSKKVDVQNEVQMTERLKNLSKCDVSDNSHF